MLDDPLAIINSSTNEFLRSERFRCCVWWGVPCSLLLLLLPGVGQESEHQIGREKTPAKRPRAGPGLAQSLRARHRANVPVPGSATCIRTPVPALPPPPAHTHAGQTRSRRCCARPFPSPHLASPALAPTVPTPAQTHTRTHPCRPEAGLALHGLCKGQWAPLQALRLKADHEEQCQVDDYQVALHCCNGSTPPLDQVLVRGTGGRKTLNRPGWLTSPF